MSHRQASSGGLASCLYRGRVGHRRYTPKHHEFGHDLFLVLLDLSELEHVFDGRLLWSVGRPNVAAFRREDQLGDASEPLDEHIRRLVAEETGTRPVGPIRLLTNLRYFGYCFNPVSFFFCYDAAGGRLETIVADVGNTPWNERHPYVLHAGLDTGSGDGHRYVFRKQFHVSPFQDMDTEYEWVFSDPGDALSVHMQCRRAGELFFDTSLRMERRPLNGGEMARVLARHPFMTGRVLFGIYAQAFLLWAKRLPFYAHPSKRSAVTEGAA